MHISTFPLPANAASIISERGVFLENRAFDARANKFSAAHEYRYLQTLQAASGHVFDCSQLESLQASYVRRINTPDYFNGLLDLRREGGLKPRPRYQ